MNEKTMPDAALGIGKEKPSPPDPTERNQPLPGVEIKPVLGDPEAPEAVRDILASPSYREASEDLDFLRGPTTRGVRLQLEYLKAEMLLRDHDVAHTIVVFGGTRIPEPQEALRIVEARRAQFTADPRNEGLAKRLLIAERLLEKSKYYTMARAFGRIVGEQGAHARDGRLLIMTGGGPGIMEAANRGASDVGALSIGLNISLPHEQYPNAYITPELCLRFHYFALRKFHFVLRARALVAFPGGFGTMDEVFEILALSQTRKTPPVPVILVGESYWKRAFDPDFLVEEGVIDPEDRKLFWFAESAEEVWQDILRWYEAKGEPLLAHQERTL